MITAETILERTHAYGISTVNENGFPKTLILPSVMSRFGFVTLYFYLDKNYDVVKNIQVNPKATIACYAELENEYVTTLNLNGTFTLVELDEAKIISEDYKRYDSNLSYENPCILLFETLSFNVEKIKKFNR
ncbi:pyridoxamine 5'-phosphate oxidase family protein [Enterococcus plantarum]|uniref:pyridoxamine 5'-phosphate oxidase family protein n=1 Tax=Enterococcus TaxID=1350 RepID=UPI001A909DA6|nr:pyridoxamine 5'-phosphate oxidase family protein [Enterococcus plantarum]MBO0424106.1 pyridoxamine 5'-phosphate oxidase family protein [Enterococcus plantarum]